MANLTVRDQAIEAYVTYISVKSGHSKDVARAFVQQFSEPSKCKNMDVTAKEKMVNWIRSNYFPHMDVSADMVKAISSVVCEAYGKFSKAEVVEAIKLAAAGRLTDVSLEGPLTPQLIGKVLKTYETQQRGDLIKAYYAAEMERQKQASQTGYVHLTEADMEAVREGIRNYARNLDKKPNKHWYYMDYITPLIEAGAIKDLPQERKESLMRNAESEARVEEYQYQQARGRQGFVSINKVIELTDDQKQKKFKELYAHELIALNKDYFATQF